MISNGKNWHYLAVKSLSRLLRGITSNHDGDYYCLNCFHSYRTEILDKSNNKLSYYRGEDCMKRFCKDLKDHAIKIIDCKKKDMISLTKEEKDNYNKENICHICKK